VLTRDGTIVNEAARKSVESQTPGGLGT
jgi:hypothetical protein